MFTYSSIASHRLSWKYTVRANSQGLDAGAQLTRCLPGASELCKTSGYVFQIALCWENLLLLAAALMPQAAMQLTVGNLHVIDQRKGSRIGLSDTRKYCRMSQFNTSYIMGESRNRRAFAMDVP